MKRWLLVAGLTVLGLCLIYILGWIFFFSALEIVSSPRLWPTEQFTTAAWQESEPEDRYRFYRDLKETGVLVGEERTTVIALLGEPDTVWPGGQQVKYILRYGHIWEFNSVYSLVIEFDDENRVQRLTIQAD